MPGSTAFGFVRKLRPRRRNPIYSLYGNLGVTCLILVMAPGRSLVPRVAAPAAGQLLRSQFN